MFDFRALTGIATSVNFAGPLLRSLLRFIVFSVASLVGYILLNEPVEHGIFKSSYLHKYWERVGFQAKLPDSAPGSPLLVFQHVPRTAGDAMRTHLFADAQIARSNPWPDLLRNVYNRTFLLDEDVEKATKESTKLIVGYFSRQDLLRINRSKKVFVFLRHPVERVLSVFHFLKPGLKRKTRIGEPPPSARFINATTFVGNASRPYSCTFTLNAMTYQLGDHHHCAGAMPKAPLSRIHPPENSEVLARAKRTLEEADFVGFYETLPTDFWELREHFFLNVQLPYYVPFFFWIATYLALPRLRVLKFSAQMTQEELWDIRGKLQLDLELWEWALQRFKPDLVLYPSYRSFYLAQLPGVLVVLLICFCLLSGCSRLVRWLLNSAHQGKGTREN